jgi:hypothetical protein
MDLYTGSELTRKNTDQAIQKSKNSKTEENDNTSEALDQFIRDLRTIPLSSSTLLSVPSKLLVFLSHQRHQKMQRGIISQTFLILILRQPSPQQDKKLQNPTWHNPLNTNDAENEIPDLPKLAKFQ